VFSIGELQREGVGTGRQVDLGLGLGLAEVAASAGSRKNTRFAGAAGGPSAAISAVDFSSGAAGGATSTGFSTGTSGAGVEQPNNASRYSATMRPPLG